MDSDPPFPANAIENPLLGVDQLARIVETATDHDLLHLMEDGSIPSSQLAQLERHFSPETECEASEAVDGLMRLHAESATRTTSPSGMPRWYCSEAPQQAGAQDVVTIAPQAVRPLAGPLSSLGGNFDLPRTPARHLPQYDMHPVFYESYHITGYPRDGNGSDTSRSSTPDSPLLVTPSFPPQDSAWSVPVYNEQTSAKDGDSVLTFPTRFTDLEDNDENCDIIIDPSLLDFGRAPSPPHSVCSDCTFLSVYDVTTPAEPQTNAIRTFLERAPTPFADAEYAPPSSELTALSDAEDEDGQLNSSDDEYEPTRSSRTKRNRTKAGSSSSPTLVLGSNTAVPRNSRAAVPVKRTFKLALWECVISVQADLCAINDPANSGVIRWESDGISGVIPDKRTFNGSAGALLLSLLTLAMKAITDARDVSGFLRQLNMWGFVRYKTDHGPNSCGFVHPHFRRGQPELLATLMRRGENIVKKERIPRKRKARKVPAPRMKTGQVASKTTFKKPTVVKDTAVKKVTAPAKPLTKPPAPIKISSTRTRIRKSYDDDHDDEDKLPPTCSAKGSSASTPARTARQRGVLTVPKTITTPEKRKQPTVGSPSQAEVTSSLSRLSSKMTQAKGSDPKPFPTAPRVSPDRDVLHWKPTSSLDNPFNTPPKRPASSPICTSAKRRKRSRI